MRVEAFAPQAPWSGIQAAARHAEAAGFDAFATPEIANDPFMTLAVAALATERIGLRTAIAVAFPRSPMVVANASWELHENSGGRFSVGLGTQVKGHNERRFSVPWSAPAARLREYVESLRAIWRCWQTGGPLEYEGEHYQFSLMTPEFRHAPNALGPIPIYTAAVRPAMLELAGRVADGVRLHGFCTRRYLEEMALPQIEAGLAEAGRPRERFEVCGGGFLATGPDEDAVRKRVDWVRYRVAFYASTRTYWPVMELHGWGDLAQKLHRMSVEGRWKEMAPSVPDEVVHTFAAVGTWDRIADAVAARFGGLSDSVELAFEEEIPVEVAAEIVAKIQAIPCRFEGHVADWS
ncbi:MAG: TIGR03617 family F420-dependent LLM class oxidoreductase [Deltaproteobacteria bacterium]|nr:TIGR03617 family F420-dependent LLM class oxidoreductase [Deltaproteobacteria bacterium]